MTKITLDAPIGTIVAINLTAIYPNDGAHGSVVFDALDAGDACVGQPARGALFTTAPSVPPTLAEIKAAVAATLA